MKTSFSYNSSVLADDITLWEFSGDPSQEQWENLLQIATQWLVQMENRGRQFRVIVDPSGLNSVTPEMRRAAGLWRGAHMPLIANVIPSACYVAESAWLRGAIHAVFWIARPVIPVTVKATRDDAVEWLKSYR